MKLKPGPHVYDISGLVSSGVITRSTSGLVLKAHRPGVDRQTDAQLAVRNSFRACGTLFRSLPDRARAWLAEYASLRPLISSSVFVRDNRKAVQAATLLEPVPFNPYVGQILQLQFSTPAPAETEDGRILVEWVNPFPQSFSKIQLLVRLPAEAFFFKEILVNCGPHEYLITGLAFETPYDLYAFYFSPGASQCGTPDGELAVLSSAYLPPPLGPFVGTGAGDDLCNEYWSVHTVSDGVNNYINESGNRWLYRAPAPPAVRWIANATLDGSPGQYGHPGADDTPFLGLYNVNTGPAPGVTIAES